MRRKARRPVLGILSLVLLIAFRCDVADIAEVGEGQNCFVARYNQDGTLDTGFDNDGIAITNFSDIVSVGDNPQAQIGAGSIGASIKNITQDYKNRIVAAGRVMNRGNNQFAIVRYSNKDGKLDAGFNTGGKMLISFKNMAYSEAEAVFVDRRSRIFIAGFAQNETGPDFSDFALVCLTDSGTVVKKFGGDGKVVTDFPGVWNETAMTLGEDETGKIVAAGIGFQERDSTLMVAIRYNNDGTPDGAFGKNGKIVAGPPPGVNMRIFDVAMEKSSRIVVAGWLNLPGQQQFALMRFDTEGNRDWSFGGNGLAFLDIPGTTAEKAGALTVDKQGGIIAAGESGEEGNNRLLLVRYQANGRLDKSFGREGIVLTDIPAISDEMAKAVRTDSKGRIIILGKGITSALKKRNLLVRYQANGSIDESFGNGGIVLSILPRAVSQEANALFIDSQDRILIGG